MMQIYLKHWAVWVWQVCVICQIWMFRIFNYYLTPMMWLEKKSQSIAKYISDQKILPITGTGRLPQLVTLSNKFWSTYKKNTSFLLYMCPGIVNGRPAIIAYVPVPKDTPVEFEGYSIFISYGVIEPACSWRFRFSDFW